MGCRWAFAPGATARPDFDPSYAIDFWDLTNRQDWAACESVQRGLASPHAKPGPLNPAEDAVYQFVTMVARGYLCWSVWTIATPARAAISPRCAAPVPRRTRSRVPGRCPQSTGLPRSAQ